MTGAELPAAQPEALAIISGRFIEGEYITVSVNGKQYRRKVFYKRETGLYITIRNRLYFMTDFD